MNCEFEIEFDEEYEQIYQRVFRRYLKRTEFEELCKISYVRSMKMHDVFKQKGDTVTSLCCLVSGRICVLRPRSQTIVNVVNENEFIEGPQWMASGQMDPEHHRFEISFLTLTDIVYIKWPRENLVQLCRKNHAIQTAVQSVLGLHTAKQLLRSIKYRRIREQKRGEAGISSSLAVPESGRAAANDGRVDTRST